MISSIKVHPERKQESKLDTNPNSEVTTCVGDEDNNHMLHEAARAELVAICPEAEDDASAYAPHIENRNDIHGKQSNDGHRAGSETSVNLPEGEKHGLQADFAEADWRSPSSEIHDDFYIRF